MLEELQNYPEAQKQLKADLQEVRQRWYQQHAARRTSSFSWLAVAAGFALLVFLGVRYYQSQAYDRLYAEQLAQATDNYLQLRGAVARSPELQSALHAYESRRYERSLLQFQTLRQENPYDRQVLLYTALSAMQLGEYPIAQSALDQLLSLDISIRERADGHWYSALLHLKMGHLSVTQEHLQWILDNTDGARRSQAEQLLPQLN